MTKREFIRVTTYAAVFGLVGGMTFEGANRIYNDTIVSEKQQKEESSAPKASVLSTTGKTADSSSGVSEIAENVLPSIVAIDVTVAEKTNDIFGRTYERESQGSGSGIIIGQDANNLYIATNNHVVADAKTVSVTFNDESVASATVKGTDSASDLAVVSVAARDLKEDCLSKIKVATIGDSDSGICHSDFYSSTDYQ